MGWVVCGGGGCIALTFSVDPGLSRSSSRHSTTPSFRELCRNASGSEMVFFGDSSTPSVINHVTVCSAEFMSSHNRSPPPPDVVCLSPPPRLSGCVRVSLTASTGYTASITTVTIRALEEEHRGSIEKDGVDEETWMRRMVTADWWSLGRSGFLPSVCVCVCVWVCECVCVCFLSNLASCQVRSSVMRWGSGLHVCASQPPATHPLDDITAEGQASPTSC